ncbi:hypothetical protein K493DRAFT_51350 [Basidiobolus meristosporus CBS 931.73]|uniref:Uncharacterized protein n=1 Tax=Basidiobolus meristosporus CBS 931.73 TaxID=1314790 RepID=A0A1Y1Y167_9FUNG|nr:hypothetical protein K493DRAFT_51350 [Basidiobolus meristosporus CBS 931.73]|eukprot:ORX91374.1 hypothetical protein K493DRAFT_51350 [Basidiobolus meristosporus CBS 931.73]
MDIPKIQVDSKEDIKYLKNEFSQASEKAFKANEKLFVKGRKKNVDLEERAQGLVNKWIEQMFKLAGNSLSVNGMEYKDAMTSAEEIEPFDEALHQEVLNLQLTTEELTMRVVERRKKVPEQVQFLVTDALKKGSMFASNIECLDTEEPVECTAEEIPTRVKKSYEDTVKLMNELKESIPNTLAKLERAQGVLEQESKAKPHDDTHQVIQGIFAKESAADEGSTSGAATSLKARSVLAQKLKQRAHQKPY